MVLRSNCQLPNPMFRLTLISAHPHSWNYFTWDIFHFTNPAPSSSITPNPNFRFSDADVCRVGKSTDKLCVFSRLPKPEKPTWWWKRRDPRFSGKRTVSLSTASRDFSTQAGMSCDDPSSEKYKTVSDPGVNPKGLSISVYTQEVSCFHYNRLYFRFFVVFKTKYCNRALFFCGGFFPPTFVWTLLVIVLFRL